MAHPAHPGTTGLLNIYDSGPPDMRTEKNAESQLISDQNSNHTNLSKNQYEQN